TAEAGQQPFGAVAGGGVTAFRSRRRGHCRSSARPPGRRPRHPEGAGRGRRVGGRGVAPSIRHGRKRVRARARACRGRLPAGRGAVTAPVKPPPHPPPVAGRGTAAVGSSHGDTVRAESTEVRATRWRCRGRVARDSASRAIVLFGEASPTRATSR